MTACEGIRECLVIHNGSPRAVDKHASLPHGRDLRDTKALACLLVEGQVDRDDVALPEQGVQCGELDARRDGDGVDMA